MLQSSAQAVTPKRTPRTTTRLITRFIVLLLTRVGRYSVTNRNSVAYRHGRARRRVFRIAGLDLAEANAEQGLDVTHHDLRSDDLHPAGKPVLLQVVGPEQVVGAGTIAIGKDVEP